MTTALTTRGVIRGVTGAGCSAFLGVPYAAPPVGERRWAPPATAPVWEGILDATRPGPAAWQPTGGPLDGLVPGMGSDDQGDDCLTLNVWTPASDDARRPVLVWVHGGAFQLGAGSLGVYDGTRLATATDSVVVTFNYRLGALGFMVVDDPSASPNVGLLDQVAALQWVHDNIAELGGDPDRVTVFGESAGGGSVLSLLSMPSATGLFQRAIVQSGATDLLLDRERATMVTECFARCAGVEPGDVAALRDLSPAAVLAAQAQAAGELFATVGTMPFHPCIDGAVLPSSWLEAAQAGLNAVPLIIGTTRDEMALFASFDPAAATLDGPSLRRRLDGAAAAGLDVENLIGAYAATGTSAPPKVWQRIQTDQAMWLPALRIAEARAAHAPVWMYRFDWPAADARLGAPHGIDIPFPFATVDIDGWDAFVADADAAMGLARMQQQLWATHARDGAPSADGVDWPAFDADRRATLVLGHEVAVVDDPNGPVRQAWGG
jgi:para-nitrobenzyl esterase